MSQAARAGAPLDPLPVTPDAESWRALSHAEQARFIEDATAALQRQADLMPEGLPHSRSKFGILSVLGDYFERVGRKVFLASELPVLYPGERPICPDLIAVNDAEDLGYQDPRTAWVVVDEGRGVDLALEVNYCGDRRKDLHDNVHEYADLRIPEYFVYDRLKQNLHGYRLPSPASARYEPIPARGGQLRSRVLGLDLVILDGMLRFLDPGGGVVPETRELLARASALVEGAVSRRDAEAAAREEAERRAEAEAKRANAEAKRADAEAKRADAEAAARAALEARLAELLARTGGG